MICKYSAAGGAVRHIFPICGSYGFDLAFLPVARAPLVRDNPSAPGWGGPVDHLPSGRTESRQRMTF